MRITLRSFALGLLALALLAAPSSAFAKKKLEVEAALVPTAAGPLAASGEIELELKGARVDLGIEVEDLPLGAYDVFIGGVNRGAITVAPGLDGDEGEIEFRNRPTNDKIFLDFDPAGLVVEIQQGGVALLSGVVPDVEINDPAADALQTNFPKQNAKIDMTNTGVAPGAQAQLRFKSKKSKADFEVAVKDLPAGTYDLFVDDVLITSAFYDGKGREKLRFSTKVRGDRLALDFDPAGATVRIAQGDVDFFTATLSSVQPLPGISGAGEIEVELAPTGAQPGAEGEAEFRSTVDEQEFSVEIEDVEAGVYDVLVDGVVVGMIVAAPTSDGVEGEIEFHSLPNGDPDNLDLTFDPRGKAIQVLKDGVVILGGALPAT